MIVFFFFQAEDGIRDIGVTGVQTCALPIYAIFGSSLKDKALIASKPPIPIGQIDASVPPAYTASWYPSFTNLYAYPIESVPVAQAVTDDVQTPLVSRVMDRCPAAIFMIHLGIKCEDIFLCPLAIDFSC